MLVLRRTVLQLGAVFLLVSLKTYGGVAKSVLRSEGQRSPDTHHRFLFFTPAPGEIGGDSSKGGNSFALTEETINGERTVRDDRTVASDNGRSVSVHSVAASANPSNFPVDNATSAKSHTIQTDDPKMSTQPLMSLSDESTLKSIEPSDGQTSKYVNPTSDTEKEAAQSEGKKESLVEAGRRAIKNLATDLKKLKKNVNSFKQNVRKLLFETEFSSIQKDPFAVRTKNDSRIRSRHEGNSTVYDAGTYNASADDVFDPFGNDEYNRSDSHTDRFTKISAAASDMNEASRRIGEFLQKQYWDSPTRSNQSRQDDIMSRGLDNLVGGVEETERGGMPPSQVLQQWVNLEESFRESVDAVVRQALPLLVRASSEMQLSNPCYTSFFQLLLGLRRLRPWAFQMIDAFGKPPAGMLQGTVTSFGAFDECVNIVAMSDAKKKSHVQQYFRGKYCTVEIKPPLPPKPQYYTMYQPVSILANFSNSDDNVIRQAARQAHAFYFLTYRMDICVPSTCTQDDVNSMAQFAAKYIDIDVAVPRCSVKEDLHLDLSQVTIICIVGVLLAFVAVGTSLDTVREIFHKTKTVTRCMSNAVSKVLLSFSLNTNAELLLNTESAQNGLDIVHGMRFFGMGWLVLGHTYFNSNAQMYGNLSEASAFAEGFFFQIIVNSTVSIDTFFFISAVLLSYLTLQSTSKHGFYSIPRLFVRRLIRVLPPYMMVMGATLLLPHLGSGPFWNETVDPVVEACKRSWWTNVLFINNFLTTPTERCLEHSWYLSCDFQLFAIALFILLALIKRPALGMALNVIMILVSMVMTGLLTYYYKVPPTLLASFPDPEERKYLNHVIISKPYCHLGPYCVGLATGYFFYKCKEIKLKAYHHMVGWGSAVSVTAAVVYGVLEWNKGNLPSTPAALAYAATHRTAWALGLSWITVVCVAGYGGIIHRILSWKVFIPLSRLTYMVYLIHPLIQYILTGYIRERLQTNHIILAYFFFGHIMTSYALSAACFFLFDGPVEALMRLLMGDCRAPAPELAKTKGANSLKKPANNNLHNEKQRNV